MTSIPLLALTIGHACTGCGKCEEHLPGVKEMIDIRGSVLINLCNRDVDCDAIQRAIGACEVGALALGEV